MSEPAVVAADKVVFTVLLEDGEGGWVMGVFDDIDEAQLAMDTYAETDGGYGPITWDTSEHNPGFRQGTAPSGLHFVIASVRMGRIDV